MSVSKVSPDVEKSVLSQEDCKVEVVGGASSQSCFGKKVSYVKNVFQGLGPRFGGSEVVPFDPKEKSSWVRVAFVTMTMLIGLIFLVIGVLALSLACSCPILNMSPVLLFGCGLGSVILGIVLISYACEWSFKMCGKKISSSEEGLVVPGFERVVETADEVDGSPVNKS